MIKSVKFYIGGTLNNVEGLWLLNFNSFECLLVFLFSRNIRFLFGADEEPSDQKKYLEDSCKPKCVKPFLEYKACVQRIEGDDSGHKHCTGQYFDYWQCVDKCVAPKLLETLK
ncbi:hypothetical protein DCAR_0624374 [Daucus carota subsp. sativus]|uniref:Complex III subunit VI n=1 Tax=Daucus carota subsp. sativus TaxID=79200 RepID=A0AAF0XD82_DAUCS|nr:hypothetical protein DCAR_0624374 [Daucus carota subsp. sativus]